VIPTGKYNFLAASCCKVEVVKGPVGDFFVGLVSKSETVYEPIFLFKNLQLLFFSIEILGSFALNDFPASLVNSATTE
jgi:hypothetical protein